jgi:non-specific serine/threonine protein kinase
MRADDAPSFATLLRRYRQAAGLTQEELAERARLSVRGITDLERGVRRAPHKETVQLLADALALAPTERATFEAAARRQAAAGPEPPHSTESRSSVRAAPGHSNLPLLLTSFVGREPEQATVAHLLGEARLVTLTGAGGCGKTRLALEVARSLLPEYGEGVWLVELAALGDPALVPQAVASVLGVRERPGQSLTASLADYLRPKRLLLLLDNCEHLVAACAELAERLLQVCPHLTVLATSREAVGIAGERAWKVPSLALPDLQAVAEQTLTCEAVQLFTQRAQAVRPAFAQTEQNAGLVAQVCRRLDGIPLALELAAARLAALSLEQLAARLDDRFRLLTGGSRTALPRQQTLRATLDWSYELLGEPERVLFHRLSVFAGGWTLEAAEAVCAGEGIAPEEVLDLLAGLVNKSLVSLEEGGVADRYRLLETMRQYARERLVAAGEAGALRDRHLAWYLGVAEQTEWPWPLRHEQAAWLGRLEVEQENMRVALAWGGAEVGRRELGLRLAAALCGWWFTRGRGSEGRRWLEDLLEGAGAAAPAVRARAVAVLSFLSWNAGDYARALALAEAAHALSSGIGDRRQAAGALGAQGQQALYLGDYTRAAATFEQLLAVSKELGDLGGVGWSWCHLGIIAHLQGDYERGAALYEQSLALLREVGDSFGVGNQLANLANVARDLGDFERAGRLHRESLAVRIDLQDKPGFMECFEGLAVVAAGQGQPERAARLFGAAEEIREAIGRPVDLADRVAHERTVPAVRAVLGEDAFHVAWAAGRAMPLEAAIVYALEHGQPPD